jgi:hypothetical protein
MNEKKKVIELITKLIYDTNDNRITWCGDFSGKRDGEVFTADYDNRYCLSLYVGNPKGSFHLALSESNGARLLDYFDAGLSDLYEAILEQTGYGRKIDEAIAHILHA